MSGQLKVEQEECQKLRYRMNHKEQQYLHDMKRKDKEFHRLNERLGQVSIYISIYLSIYISIYLSINLYIYLSTYQSIYLFSLFLIKSHERKLSIKMLNNLQKQHTGHKQSVIR